MFFGSRAVAVPAPPLTTLSEASINSNSEFRPSSWIAAGAHWRTRGLPGTELPSPQVARDVVVRAKLGRVLIIILSTELRG